MEQRELKVELRTGTGKNACRQLRAKNLVPGVVYGKGMDAVAVTVDPKELQTAIAGEGGRNNLITLRGGGSVDGNVVIVADLLCYPLRGDFEHVDLHKINLTEKVRVKVAVNLLGTAKGVKDGGLLDFATHAVEVECIPTAIPEHVDVDVTELGIGHSIHLGDISLPAGVKVLGDPKAPVVSILGKSREEEAAPAE